MLFCAEMRRERDDAVYKCRIAGLDYVAAMFALNGVSSYYVFHWRVYYGKRSLSDDCVRGRICYIKILIYCGDKINGCAAI